MDIHPNIIIHQQSLDELKGLEKISLLEVPDCESKPNIDAGNIDKIRNQLLPTDIDIHTTSTYKDEIVQMVNLLNSHCKELSIDEIIKTIKEIHETLNNKKASLIKGWTRLLTSLHPLIDDEIKNLPYWKTLYSEIIGTNTILYHADMNSIDIMFWSKKPLSNAKTCNIEWSLSPSQSPSYLRDSVREKMDSKAVEFLQNAGQATSSCLRRNIIFDAIQTTLPETGGEVPQKRPILEDVPHGVSLANDWYHQVYRIIDGDASNKNMGRHDAIHKLSSGGYFVHLLVNHLTPLLNITKAERRAYINKNPLGVEVDTFPFKADKELEYWSLENNDRVLPVSQTVDDNVIKPTINETTQA